MAGSPKLGSSFRPGEECHAPGPTRRALLALVPASLLDGPDLRRKSRSVVPMTGASPLEQCWADLVTAIRDQDAAIDHRDWLERVLLHGLEAAGHFSATKGLDGQSDEPPPEIDESFVPIGEVLAPLIKSLADRHAAWEQAATLIGLPKAEEAQAIASSGVKWAASDLIQQPAANLTHLRLKLVALLSVHEPGPGWQHETPWRELRLMLTDVEALLQTSTLPRTVASPSADRTAL